MASNSNVRKRGFIGKIITFLFTTILLALAGGVFAVYSIVQDLPNPERISDRSIAESTKIYDRTGDVLLFEIHGNERRTVVPLAKIPHLIQQATIVAEDIRFYDHHGIDFRGILRAAITNIKNKDISQGGSTITQQLIKNSILTSERTFTRKIREQILALLLERRYSKNEILEWYLNQIPYGSNAYGISAAADLYFAKKLDELTLNEAALLAALPKAPTYYSPYGNRIDQLVERKNWILDRMAEAGFITAEDAKKAKNEKLSFVPPQEEIRAPHFVFYVRELLNKKYGEEFVERGGLKVITTLDWKLQEEAEKIVKEGAERNDELVRAGNAALVAIDPRTGDVLTLVGSRDYWGDPLPEGCTPGANCRFDPFVNAALRSRQPGSAFKPFVYATAFQKGYTPETVLFDASTEFNPRCNPDNTPGPLFQEGLEECYQPKNYDNQFRGPVTLRQALAQSLNVPSVKLLYLAGVYDSIRTAQEMGITTLTDPQRYGLSLVLGGAEVTLAEMVSAFGVFATEGILHPKTFILRIENSNGDILEEKKERAIPALDTDVARTMNDVLSDNEARIPMFNPRSSLYFPGRDVAAKTGTTQDYRDAWVIGYTPSLAAGVWVGNNDNTPMDRSGLSIMVAGPIWHTFLEFAFEQMPPEEFTPPQKESANKKYALRGFYRSGPVVKIDTFSQKRATEYTPEEFIEEKSFGAVVPILSFIQKGDPLGDPPLNPAEDDPQFKNWLAGIQRWIGANPNFAATTTPPSEFDDIHTPEKKPNITLITPPENRFETPPISEIRITAESVFPLREISLFINNQLRSSKTTPIIPGTIVFPLDTPLTSGAHTIEIVAYDGVGNITHVKKQIRVTEDQIEE